MSYKFNAIQFRSSAFFKKIPLNQFRFVSSRSSSSPREATFQPKKKKNSRPKNDVGAVDGESRRRRRRFRFLAPDASVNKEEYDPTNDSINWSTVATPIWQRPFKATPSPQSERHPIGQRTTNRRSLFLFAHFSSAKCRLARRAT